MSSVIVSVATPPTSRNAFTRSSEVDRAPEGSGASVMTGGHQHVEEQALFTADAVIVEGSGVVEVLRTLYQRDLLVGEPAEGRGEEAREGDVITVEHCDDVDGVGTGGFFSEP